MSREAVDHLVPLGSMLGLRPWGASAMACCSAAFLASFTTGSRLELTLHLDRGGHLFLRLVHERLVVRRGLVSCSHWMRWRRHLGIGPRADPIVSSGSVADDTGEGVGAAKSNPVDEAP